METIVTWLAMLCYIAFYLAIPLTIALVLGIILMGIKNTWGKLVR